MTDSNNTLTSKAKLSLSRAELLGAMGYEEIKSATQGVTAVAAIYKPEKRSTGSALAKKLGQSVVGRWWSHHPLNSVVQIGQPLLESYARKNPAKLVAYGAGAGAVVWMLKPWKLLSAATVLTLVFKRSDILGIVADIANRRSRAE